MTIDEMSAMKKVENDTPIAATSDVKCKAMKGTDIDGMTKSNRKVGRNCPGVGSYLLYSACVT